MPQHFPQTDTDELIEQLRDRISARRLDGTYPAGVETELAARAQQAESELLADLHTAMDAADRLARLQIGRDHISYESALPGGSNVHRAVGAVASRQTIGVLSQLSEVRNAVDASLRSLLTLVRRLTEMQLAADTSASAAAGSVASGVDAAAIEDLQLRVEALELADRRRSFRPWFTLESFEDWFRIDDDQTRERLERYADHFVDAPGPVLDIGCGRGGFLEVLGEAGIAARGVEIVRELVDECVDKGLDVAFGDGVTVLESLPDDSLGGVASLQVVEHLEAQQTLQLVGQAARKIAPGGRIVLETVNPQSLYALSHAYVIDPTHVRPVHPSYLAYLVAHAGFADVRIELASPPPRDEVLSEVPENGPAAELAAAVNENVRRLNELVFGPQDYAVLARR